MTAAAAEKHEGHQTASNEKRKECAETEGDPAVLIHHDVAGGVPYHRCPYASENEQGNENCDKSDWPGLSLRMGSAFPFQSPTGELNQQGHPFLSEKWIRTGRFAYLGHSGSCTYAG